MNMINLNESTFDSKEFSVFNDRKAGIAENIAIRADLRKAEDKDGAPNLRIVFIDPHNQGEVNFGLWTLEGAKDPEKAMLNLGRTAKHILHAIYGQQFTIPAFKDDVELIQYIKSSVDSASTMRFRVAVNYGTPDYPATYLSVKRFPPFMENMLIPKEDTKLFLGTKDLLTPVTADASPAAAEKPTTSWVDNSKPSF